MRLNSPKILQKPTHSARVVEDADPYDENPPLMEREYQKESLLESRLSL